MQQQLSRAQLVFYLGLSLMLGTAILSAVVRSAHGFDVLVLMLAGALLAAGARVWKAHLQRSCRHRDSLTGLGFFR